jgi:hypothetical protein
MGRLSIYLFIFISALSLLGPWKKPTEYKLYIFVNLIEILKSLFSENGRY